MSSALEMVSIGKRFGAVQALEKVDLSVEPGAIHAVVGENGAGKTTLMRILYGVIQPDEGAVRLSISGDVAEPANPHDVHFRDSRDAIAAGIGMVSQHYGIIPALTCLQNLILGAEGGALLDLRAAEQRAKGLASRMGFEFSWHQDASTLSPAGAQKLEILKLLWREARIMILDEPTAMLSPADSDALFQSLGKLAAEGATVILVTHRLPEVMDHCSRVTVLRGGRLVATKNVSDTNPKELAALIIGSASDAVRSIARQNVEAERETRLGDPMLEIRNLVVRGSRGEEALKQIALSVRSGELVGIAGVDGSGQRELFQSILGLVRAREGQILIDGEDSTREKPIDRIRQGLRTIPEDRHAEAVIEQWSLEQNAALGLQRLEPLSKSGFVQTAERLTWAARVADKFDTKHGGLRLPMGSLSGGNQQRFVAGRAIESKPKLLLAFQPARGLDLKGSAAVYEAIRERCREGSAAIVVSFDLDELIEHCDRVVAMNHGKLITPPEGLSRDRKAIGRLMVGAD
jgi:ABC-type uncharacterized transport system ATPase subunit